MFLLFQTAKQTELDSIRQQKDELERELAEWRVKAESQDTFQSYILTKEEEIAALNEKVELQTLLDMMTLEESWMYCFIHNIARAKLARQRVSLPPC